MMTIVITFNFMYFLYRKELYLLYYCFQTGVLISP